MIMRKLTKMSLQELAAKMPAIDENTQESCVGGNYYFDIQTGSYLGQDWFGPMAGGSGVYLMSYDNYITNVLCSGHEFTQSGVFSGSGEYITNAPLSPKEVLHNVLEYYRSSCGLPDFDYTVRIASSTETLDWNLEYTEVTVPETTIYQEDLVFLFMDAYDNKYPNGNSGAF